MKYCAVLSLILVLAKIFSLITLSWLACLAPVLIAVLVKVLIIFILFLFSIFLMN